jgi:hypothetical protein
MAQLSGFVARELSAIFVSCSGGATRRASLLWEVYVLRFEEALERYRKRRLTAEETGELLGMWRWHFRRLIVRYEEEGSAGLRDRRFGKPLPRPALAAELTRMQRLYQERYRDFTVKHFHEQLQKRHDELGHTVIRLSLQAGLVAKTMRGGAHRQKRERRPHRRHFAATSADCKQCNSWY